VPGVRRCSSGETQEGGGLHERVIDSLVYG